MSDISHKAEKLASAIYLITSFFNDQEPIKWKLRSLAAEFVSVAMHVRNGLSMENESIAYETKPLIVKLDGLLSVAKNAGLISAGNYDLMHGELMKYIASLEAPVDISGLLSAGKEEEPEAPKFETNSPQVLKDRIKYVLPEKVSAPMLVQKDKSLRDFGAVSVKKNSRQSIIISVLKRKKEIMIKDVVPLINNCSEKTVQRELTAMVEAGVLKKIGEKRWSRYSLA